MADCPTILSLALAELGFASFAHCSPAEGQKREAVEKKDSDALRTCSEGPTRSGRRPTDESGGCGMATSPVVPPVWRGRRMDLRGLADTAFYQFPGRTHELSAF